MVHPRDLTFGLVDFIVFITMLLISLAIGLYFGFFAKSKNTTSEYLMGGKKMQIFPIAVSLIASQLSAVAIILVPSENYTFGGNYMFFVIAMLPVIPFLCYAIVPVFYENNLNNCYEYLEKRFSKSVRNLITMAFMFNGFLMVPVYTFLPSLAFSQVTGLNIHLINTIVSAVCVFYTMLGGIKAVVWTDVVQGLLMLIAVLLVGMLGTLKTGGFFKVLEYANDGGRLTVNLSLDPRVRTTFWNSFISGLFIWTEHVGLNQTCVQRIIALPSVQHARKSLLITGIGIVIIMGFNSYTGIAMYSYYHDCDPLKAGYVEKPDKLMPFFVQDILGHLQGFPGIFITCIFSAALSTLSANLNSMAGVVYFDCIRPFVGHTEARANYIMKLYVAVMGIYCIAGGLIVQHFNSILQMILTITGMTTGAVIGVFLLGMFVPRASTKAVITGIVSSLFIMIWLVINAQLRFKEGLIQYTPLETRVDGCEERNMNLHNIANSTSLPTLPLVTTAFGSNRSFSIFEISFAWYKVIGAILVWLTAIPLSYIWKVEKRIDIKLFSPLIRGCLKSPAVVSDEMEPVLLLRVKTEVRIVENNAINRRQENEIN